MAGELSEFFTNIRAWDYLKNENRAFWQSAGTLCFFRCGYSPDLLAALQGNPGQLTPFFASRADGENAALEQDITQQEKEADSIEQFILRAKKYPNLQELTPAVLNDLVNKVYVHAPHKSGGHRVQDVNISLVCIGFLPESIIAEMLTHASKKKNSVEEVTLFSLNLINLSYVLLLLGYGFQTSIFTKE